MQKYGALAVIKKITSRWKQQRAMGCTCDLPCIVVCTIFESVVICVSKKIMI
jgi:hypothetical protein